MKAAPCIITKPSIGWILSADNRTRTLNPAVNTTERRRKNCQLYKDMKNTKLCFKMATPAGLEPATY